MIDRTQLTAAQRQVALGFMLNSDERQIVVDALDRVLDFPTGQQVEAAALAQFKDADEIQLAWVHRMLEAVRDTMIGDDQ